MIRKSLGTPGGKAPLSKRWLVDARCKRLGWVMVPHTARADLENEIADAFDEFVSIIFNQKIVVHPMLLNRIQSLEKSMIEKLYELAENWRKTRIERFEEARVEVVTNRIAMAIILDLVAALFVRLDNKISDYNLIDMDTKDGELVFCAIEVLDERVTEAVTTIVRSWK
jgi:hypothetical protein